MFADSNVRTKNLHELLPDFSACPNILVSGLQLDSRAVQSGDLFFGLSGQHYQADRFVEEALQKGAVAVLLEANDHESTSINFIDSRPIVSVSRLKEKVSEIAGVFFNYPSHQLDIMGVTGTNGKTTCSQFLAQALSLLGVSCGVIGTVGVGVVGQLSKATHTTPDAISVQKYLANFVDQGCKAVTMEVSSHGLDQHRVDAVSFHTALFTNLTRDHLDYHGDMQTYGAAKEKLFIHPELQRAVINLDDAFGQTLARKISKRLPVYTYSLESQKADIFVNEIHASAQGIRAILETPWGSGEIISPLLGRFNLSNLLGVLGVLCGYGYELHQVLDVLSQLRSVSGRMQTLGGNVHPVVVVDYAHTPDALEQVLATLRDHCAGKLWCVFGCGGDRDKGKRPLMAAVVERFADYAVVTTDNPRFENSENIIHEIMVGFSANAKHNVKAQPNRETAIIETILQAAITDVILIAGKGHEDYQEIKGYQTPFDDVAVAASALKQRKVMS